MSAEIVVAKMKTCGCGRTFEAGLGCHEGLDVLSVKTRKVEFSPRYPLTPTEVADAETCRECAGGINALSTTFVLNYMAELITKNAERIKREQAEEDRRRELEESRHVRSLEYAMTQENRGLNNVFATAKPRAPRVHHGRHYVGNPKPHFDPNAPKKFGDEKRPALDILPGKKGKNKKNKGGNEKGGKRRGSNRH